MNKAVCMTVFFLCLFTAARAHDVKVYHPEEGRSDMIPFRVALDAMKPFGRTFKATDPNFIKDGQTAFTGIRLKKIFELAGIDLKSGITMIGQDQYVGFLPKEKVEQAVPHLVWEIDGKPISRLKGGLLKIVYPDAANIHGSCYIWYVDALVSGRIEPAAFELNVKNSRHYVRLDDLAGDMQTIDHRMFSAPAGCRIGLKPPDGTEKIQAVPLKRLLESVKTETFRQVTLVTFAGSPIKLAGNALDYPIYILMNRNGQPVHPAFGGPFSVIFPVEKFPALASVAPESGALFFLESIRID